jgi:hypothetical protein
MNPIFTIYPNRKVDKIRCGYCILLITNYCLPITSPLDEERWKELGTKKIYYEQRDSNSYGIIPLFLKKRLATNFSMFAAILYLIIIPPLYGFMALWLDSLLTDI